MFTKEEINKFKEDNKNIDELVYDWLKNDVETTNIKDFVCKEYLFKLLLVSNNSCVCEDK